MTAKRRGGRVIGAALLALSLVPTSASPQGETPPTFGIGTAKVLLDVVVRDRKGRLVRDLRPGDFEVYEDGVKQAVDSFDVVSKEEPPPASAGATPQAEGGAIPTTGGQAAAPSQAVPAAPTVIAFVFDRMSTGGRDMAHRAALTYVEKGHVEGDLAGVFVVEAGLRTVESFTTDLGLLRLAFDRALQQGNAAGAADDRAKTRAALTSMSRAELGVASTGAGTPVVSMKSVSAARTAANRIQVRLDRTFEALERDAGGYSTVNALLAVVSGLSSMPGRKTVVFFSEGMTLPPAVQVAFRSVIAAANRANVSVYAMDAGGLRVESDTTETRREIDQTADRRMAQLSGDAPDTDLMKQLERNEDLLRLSPGSGLGQLAEQTGGILIRATNDASGAFRRLEEDMRFYYLLSYVPLNNTYDGTFRRIAVKLTRPGLEVQARKGYLAVKPSDAMPVLTYEAPAVAALDRRPGPEAFPLGLAALSFPETDKPGLVSIVVEVPPGVVAYRPSHEKKAIPYADFSVVVRIRDGEHQEVSRVSRHYAFGKSESRTSRTHDLLFYREANLPPGRYTVEAAGYDGVARKASVRATELDVPRVADGRPRLSSLVLVTHADPLAPDERKNVKPLYFGDTVLYPGSSGEAFPRGSASGLSFFFTVYGAGATPCEASIEVRKGDQAVKASAALLPAPDAAGRIQYAGVVPLDSFAAGSYSLKVTVADGRGSDARAVPFTVVE
jgi:VWFA-related protein